MKDIYFTLMCISYGIFIINFVLSWFGGDLDIDLDGTTDLGIGDLVTFKGMLHSLMGVSTWLYFSPISGFWNYVVALVMGIAFVVILYYCYNLILSLSYEPCKQTGECLVGRIGKITFKHSDYYRLFVDGFEIKAYSKSDWSVGDQVLITSYKNNKYYI